MLVLASYLLLILGTLQILLPWDRYSLLPLWPSGYIPLGSHPPERLAVMKRLLEERGIQVLVGDAEEYALLARLPTGPDELTLFVPMGDVGVALDVFKQALVLMHPGPPPLRPLKTGRRMIRG